MSRQRRLDRLERRRPDLELDTPWPPTPQGVKVAGQVMTRRLKAGIPPLSPEVIELLAEEVIRQLNDGTPKSELQGVMSGLLESEHVPQELKEELRML